MVERFNKTLKDMMYKYFTDNKKAMDRRFARPHAQQQHVLPQDNQNDS